MKFISHEKSLRAPQMQKTNASSVVPSCTNPNENPNENQNEFSINVVISRCSEDLAWVARLANVLPSPSTITVYNKGPANIPQHVLRLPNVEVVPLPNIGGESQAYLHHIVTHYDKLADVLVFLKGWPFDHSPMVLHDLGRDRFVRPHGYTDLCAWIAADDSPENPLVPTRAVYESLFRHPAPSSPVEFGVGAQFAVAREAILARPLSFYQRALDCTETQAHTNCAFHRLWKRVFGA